MLLVSIYMSDPIDVRVLQFNRNFYHPVENFPDMWLFHVYRREGFVGLHYYFQQVFDVDLTGIAYISMDRFEQFVDEMGMIYMDGELMDGQATLAYLRSNENNWGCNPWDCENRQFNVLMALVQKIKTRFGESPLQTATKLYKAYGGLFETDLSDFEQVHWLVELGWQIATQEYVISGPYKMDNSEIFIYDDTPLEVRGWIQRDGHNVQEWVPTTLED
jgi:hypothetical protein